MGTARDQVELTRDSQVVASAQFEEARRLFAGPVRFLLSAPALRFLPEPSVPEVAVWGRSNVGKSSLINAMTGRRAIARTSVTPGRTQELNIFEIGEPCQFRLVDMPGYGFAKAPPAVTARWRKLVRDFLRGRTVLRTVLLLIDSRHGIKPIDREMMALLDELGAAYRLVLTKADKVNKQELESARNSAQSAGRDHSAAYPEVVATSAQTRLGIVDLRMAVFNSISAQAK